MGRAQRFESITVVSNLATTVGEHWAVAAALASCPPSTAARRGLRDPDVADGASRDAQPRTATHQADCSATTRGSRQQLAVQPPSLHARQRPKTSNNENASYTVKRTYMLVWLREGRDPNANWCPAGLPMDQSGPRATLCGTGRSGVTKYGLAHPGARCMSCLTDPAGAGPPGSEGHHHHDKPPR